MKEPLNQFADRLVRNGEVKEFIKGLVIEKGVSPTEIMAAMSEGAFDEGEKQKTDRTVGFFRVRDA